MILEGYDDTKSIIKVYDLRTNNEIISYDFPSLGHANDVTYNKNNNTGFKKQKNFKWIIKNDCKNCELW